LSLCGRSLVSLNDLTTDELVRILDAADRMAASVGFDDPSTRSPNRPLDSIMASLFFEPSTRTRLSFESAMLRLGGQVLGFADPAVSSVKKGESLADTIRMASGYADIIVMRHPQAGAAKVAADYASVPVINAGDGPHQHPTQTLTDLFCIRREKGTLAGLKVGLCGDLKYGRTVHSLAPMMARLGSQCVCIAPPELRMPGEVLDEVERLSRGTGVSPVDAVVHRPLEVQTLEEALPELDVLYMTRVQRERFDSPEDYQRVAGCFVLTPELMARAPESMIVLHPLPRVDEIATAVDADPRALYFRQAAGGVPVRMALIALLLGMDREVATKGSFRFGTEPAPAALAPAASTAPAPEPHAVAGKRCSNPRCVTQTEAYLEPLMLGDDDGAGTRCAYCEEKVG
jgi:aspartate carbamoyltransferase catalytic subunit